MGKTREFLARSDLTPQDIMQAFTHVLWVQQFGKKLQKNEVRSLTGNIERLGGLKAIEDWLKEYDPGHNVPSSFDTMDWDWLRKDLRLPEK